MTTNNGTQTASTPARIKTAHCIVTYGARFVEIENRETGRGLRLDIPLSWDWESFKGLDGELIKKLRTPRTFNVVELTATEMLMFKALCEGTTYDPFAGKGTPPAPTLAPNHPALVAPAIPPVVASVKANAPVVPPIPSVVQLINALVPASVKAIAAPLPTLPPVNVRKESARMVVNHIMPVAPQSLPPVNTVADVNREERELEGLHAILKGIPEEGYAMMVYDIPDVRKADCPSPCNTIWRHGFYINLSCAVVPVSRLEHKDIRELFTLWREHGIERHGRDPVTGKSRGVKFHVVPYHDAAMSQIRDIAREQIDERIRALHTSLITNIASADDVYAAVLADESKTAADGEKAEDARNNKVRTQIRQAGENLTAAIQCAELFDETESLSDLLRGLREAIASQATSFNAAMSIRGRKGVPVPPEVM